MGLKWSNQWASLGGPEFLMSNRIKGDSLSFPFSNSIQKILSGWFHPNLCLMFEDFLELFLGFLMVLGSTTLVVKLFSQVWKLLNWSSPKLGKINFYFVFVYHRPCSWYYKFGLRKALILRFRKLPMVRLFCSYSLVSRSHPVAPFYIIYGSLCSLYFLLYHCSLGVFCFSSLGINVQLVFFHFINEKKIFL